MYNNDYTQKRQHTISQLNSRNLPALPVAPPQSALHYPSKNKDKYDQPIPAFTGKNPSRLDEDGKPHLVAHKKYTSVLPTAEDLQIYFVNPKTGIGTLGGWNGWIFLDFDLKNFDGDKQACKAAAFAIADNYRERSGTEPFLQESHSGGWHVGIRVTQKPDFTNFALTPGGKHVGEAQGEGRFIVLAPTIGISGNPYVIHQWGEPTGEVESLESIGIYSTKSVARQAPQVDTLNKGVESIPSGTNPIPLEELGTETSQQILNGADPKGNRSESLTTALKEWYGWQNWTRKNGITISGTPEDLGKCAGEKLGIDSDRIDRIINGVDGADCTPAAYQYGDKSCWQKIYRLDKATFEQKCPSLVKGELKPWVKDQESSKRSNHSIQKVIVTGDSRVDGDSRNVDVLSIEETVTTVTDILNSGFSDWLEINKLEDVRVKSELSNKQAFYALVNGLKTQFDAVQPEDEIRLKTLIDWHDTNLDFHKALPSMANDILHDAEILNIDPIGIWQYLLPAVLSLAGKRVNLDIDSHEIPAIAWTAVLADSGVGKTRAEKLITTPLKQLQKQSRERFEAELNEWKETIANWKEGDGVKPPKPVERKYLFDVATIQSVMRRQSEQGLNGSLWARDELVGIFQSFGQFNKGAENEALSCLLASWDGGSSQVDRVNQEDSYFIDASRLSIAGGLQPGVFKKAFKDPDDSQGLQARFLFAAMKPKKPKRVKGFCYLSEKLPPMYLWLDTLPEGKIKLSTEADDYYAYLYEQIGEQAFNTSMPAIRAWMSKLSGQLLRIALGLHLIECYHDRNRPLWALQKDTLEKAVIFAQYYRSTFQIVQTTAADTDDISAILLQIWDKALTRHPEGISVRDAYREIKAIQYRAKDAGRSSNAYTVDLFTKLEAMGKGTVVKSGRSIKFVATLTPPPVKPPDDGGKTESENSGDRVTIAETTDISTSELSPESELSPVTNTKTVVADVEHLELEEQENSSQVEEVAEKYDTDAHEALDNEPQTGGAVKSSEPHEIKDSDELVPSADCIPTQPATMESDKQTYKWKGQIIWHIWSVFESRQVTDCISDDSDLPMPQNFRPMTIGRLIDESNARKVKGYGKALVEKTAELEREYGYKLQTIEIQALKYEGTDYWMCGYWIDAKYEVENLVDEVRDWTVIDTDGHMSRFKGRIQPSNVV